MQWGQNYTLMNVRIVLLAFLAFLPAPGQGQAAAPPVIPLARAHAHNDYLHARPLLDALDQGFTSVEADVWLVNGALLVAHDLRDAVPGRTLRTLYLEPLRHIAGEVFPGSQGPFQLLIDIKSDGAATYQALHETLGKYEPLLTIVRGGQVRPGPVRVVVSGNRPRALMLSQAVRYAGMDGRLPDLGAEIPAGSIPLISDNWMLQFRWAGIGPMPDDERARLRSIVTAAHRRGQRVRFWATPDAAGAAREAVWTELLRSGVDYINTDDLEGLRRFLLQHDPAPSVPHR